MQDNAPESDIQRVIDTVSELGFEPHPIYGVNKTVIAVIGDKTIEKIHALESLPGVEHIALIDRPYKLVSRQAMQENTVVDVAGVPVGSETLAIIAGPCAVESAERLFAVAERVKAAGANILRGGAFKPRTSPYAFQGLREEGLKLLAEARQRTGLPVVTEVLDTRHVELVSTYADALQIGARNMQNFSLLTEVGKTRKPVVLKRGPSSTVEEFLMAAEYIMCNGNERIILCERGIRTFEKGTRYTLDISAVAAIRRLSHLPIIVDPSHATGHWWMVPAMAKAAVAAGADGIMVEVHVEPSAAAVDGAQSLTPDNFDKLMEDIRALAGALGRRVA